MFIKVTVCVVIVAVLSGSAFGQEELSTGIGSKDVSFGETDCVQVTGAAVPSNPGHTLKRLYLEFKSNLPDGSHIELWWTSGVGAPWDGEGVILDTWVMEETTGSLVKLDLGAWIANAGTGTLYLREGSASDEDASVLDASAVTELSIAARFKATPDDL